jgi:chitodextrinase
VTGAPSVPAGLAATNVTPTAATLSWTASTDIGQNVVAGYNVLRDNVQVASVTTGTTFNDTGLTPDTTYSYQVASFDASPKPNVSALSVALPVTTALAAAVTPSVPTGLAASNLSATGATLSWTASTDVGGPGLGGYNVLRDGVQVGTVTDGSSAFNDTGLTATTTHSYQVSAFDTATPPNVSLPSTALPVTTTA